MKNDRFLLALLVFIGILVALSLVMFFTRQSTLEYTTDEAPDGVVRNYVVALLKKDYHRAYGYLQESENKPDYVSFERAFISRQLEPARTSLEIGQVTYSKNEAWVEVTIFHGSSGLFGEAYNELYTATLIQNAQGEWKLTNMPYSYWNYDWYPPTAIPVEQAP